MSNSTINKFYDEIIDVSLCKHNEEYLADYNEEASDGNMMNLVLFNDAIDILLELLES